ncbi:RelA/SpoT family protein [Pseudomarimonas salicorniae]|uniref:GTP pyrophosphokinase n=1 Tax=Pseudomarimonas salicorniae TaxID=2933270 RepID=A0ABT0GH74_9GAMM|nr:bifunctional (p)ppGpp synthetase/guanosine-3',5'-bis(diphosphate) 3'-pyrophosphohydrolase [Lysobacter sp. CAU 1642]MCK7593887.1 bifunctional (p)ppGpp synthetase/guanosine-3',5'-bis(diphosphate) 3'-pyrophosphohydrolase [Lysobacter sp. CAU 1642]
MAPAPEVSLSPAASPVKRAEAPPLSFAVWIEERPESAPALPAALVDWVRERLASHPPFENELVQTLAMLDTLGADRETLIAATLYPMAEGQAAPPIEPGSADAVELLVQGQREAEKVWSIYVNRHAQGGAEGLRRLLLAIIRDLRVVLILLARQLVRMRLASALPEAERRELAQLTSDIHSPLANRLGIWQVKWELEDLAFRYLQPDTYKRIAKLLDERRADRERFIEAFKRRLREALREAGIDAEVAGRPKHIYSIWKKMQRKGLPFSELYDIRAVRVLVEDVGQCYAALGTVHGLWTPVAKEFDDYIAHPKGNNYRSLHTAVVGEEGKTVEVQIRTREMHAHAELGVAAHWRYKEGGGADAGFERKIAWMRQLLDSSQGEEEGALAAGLSTELVEDRVYLLTPQGQVIDLPRGGTVLDFAYHVHTEVGHRCRGAKVNGRIVPLTHQPRSGERVEILTGKTSEPRRDWLLPHNGYLGSARARDKVRAWFHKLDLARNLSEGREVLERELKRLGLHQQDLASVLPKLRLQKLDDLYVAVALGDVGPTQVARALHEAQQPEPEAPPARQVPSNVKPPKPASGFTVEGVGNLLTQIAKCCQPVAGDAIVGYLTQGRGVSIHREGCASLERLAARHPERLLPVEWGRRGGQSFAVGVQVRAYDRKSLLKDLTNVIGTSSVHILSLDSRVDEDKGAAELRFSLKVQDYDQLGTLLARLSGVPGVLEVRRAG